MCKKIKYDKIGAMFALSQTIKSKSYKRMEKRIYYGNDIRIYTNTIFLPVGVRVNARNIS